MVECADQAKIVTSLGQHRQMFAETNSGSCRRRGFEGSDDVAGSIWFTVEGLQLTGASKQVNEDD